MSACLPVAPLGHVVSDPCGNRTRPSSVRGWRPEPIDERAVSVRRAGVEPAMPEGGWVTATWARQCPADANSFSVARVGVEPTDVHQGFGHHAQRGRGRFTSLRTVPSPQASPMGFEPTIFAVTGRRALQAAPRGRIDSSGPGGSRTHSIPGSKPRWSSDCLPSHVSKKCPERELNSQTRGFKPRRSSDWRTWAS